MTNKDKSEVERNRVEQIEQTIKIFRTIINEVGAVENHFYLDSLPPQSLDALRSWLWIPFEAILEPDEVERFKKLRILLTDPIDVLLDVSKNSTSLDEYIIILREKFKWEISDPTNIHCIAHELLRKLSYDTKRIEQAISIILTTVSQWNAGAMMAHRTLLTLFRPLDQTITHAEIIPMHFDTVRTRLFACYYPRGGNYAERLQEFLTDHQIQWVEDVRTKNSDCFGMLIAGPNGDLETAMTRITNVEQHLQTPFQYGTENFDENEFWNAVSEEQWSIDLSDLDVVAIHTDWKHLETDEHGSQLEKVGIRMVQSQVEQLGLTMFTLSLI